MHPAVTEALRHVGERDGSPYLARVGLKVGSWCAAFMVTCFDIAVPGHHLPRSPRVHTNWVQANRYRLRVEVITPRGAAWGKQVKPGDVMVVSHDPDSSDWAGHTGIVTEVLPGNQVKTVEGNTSCPASSAPFDAEKERNGNCIAVKVRGIGPHSFRLMGFYRERSR